MPASRNHVKTELPVVFGRALQIVHDDDQMVDA
jgi:hypothetical protein